MDYSLAAFILLIIGLSLVFVEVFIPSGGVLMIISISCIAGAIWSGHAAWYETSAYKFWIFLTSTLLLIPVVVVLAVYYLPRTGMGKKILLEAPELDDVTPFQEEQERLKKLIGMKGKTVSLLKPSGMVLIEGERFDCQTEGGILTPGSTVKVIDVRERRLIVRETDEQLESPTGQADASGSYDFEIPENEES